MSQYTGLSIDGGMSNGMCIFGWGDDEPFSVQELHQFSGGAPMLARALGHMKVRLGRRGTMPSPMMRGKHLDALVVEKFTPRSGAEFALTRASAEPLRCEGVVIGLGLNDFIQWGEPSQQYFMGGETLIEKKRRAREFLKLHGLYTTGQMVGMADADDAISAELHAIAWLRRVRHMPTIEMLFKRGAP